MGLRYSQVAFDFDPSDFLDVADSRPFSSANSGIRDGWIVAERIGVMGDQVVVAAAHRRGPHLFVVSGQCPKEHKKPLMTHLTTLSAGLVVEAEVAPFAGTYQTANLQAPALSFVCPKNAHIDLQQDAVSLRIPFGEHHAELLISQAPMEAPEKALNGASVMLSKRYGQPQRGSIRNAQIEEGALESNNFGVVRSMTLRNGQELCLVVLRSQKTSRTLAVQGLYPGSTQSSRAWMAARFAMSRLVGTLKNENE
jgi:hypothetical protein